jgi:hypothetical protein
VTGSVHIQFTAGTAICGFMSIPYMSVPVVPFSLHASALTIGVAFEELSNPGSI